MTKRLTITDLLKQKDKLKKDKKVKKKAELYVEELDANIVIEEPDRALVVDSLEMSDDSAGSADAYMAYMVIVEPNLKDKELQKEYGCVEPTEIIDMLFSPGTITSIAKHALELAGYNKTVKVVDDLKN